MASGDRKKGRENKKPKQPAKSTVKSDYQARKGEVVAAPYQGKRK